MGDELVWRRGGDRERRDPEYDREARRIRRAVRLTAMDISGDRVIGNHAITELRNLDEHRADVAEGASEAVQLLAADIEAEIALSIKQRIRRRASGYDV